MRFRPCIDIHNGKVKQIVGGSLRDQGDQAEENFVADQDAAYFARLYGDRGLKGGHMILLNSAESEFYQKTKDQALQCALCRTGNFSGWGRDYAVECGRIFKGGSIPCDRHFLCVSGRKALL